MSDVHSTAVALAAMELLPAEPGDLANLLSDPAERVALMNLHATDGSRDLTAWLCSEIDHGRVERWEKRLDRLTIDLDVRAVLAGDGDYPARLASTWSHPPVLFIRGELRQEQPTIAIVGSRAAGETVVEVSRQIAERCAQNNWSVVSGLAAGVDTAAHTGALTGGGHTIAVMGTGITHVFPADNTAIAQTIAEQGGLVSQFSPDAPRTSTTFLWRNRVIAALADVDLVMDGRERSGSAHQCDQAVRLGRPVMLWAPTLGTQPWARSVVDAGSAVFVDSVDEVLKRLKESPCVPR